MDDDAAIEDTIYGRTPLIEDTIIEILKDEELQSRNHSGPGRLLSLGCSISALRA
jgi:hypothetical protein